MRWQENISTTTYATVKTRNFIKKEILAQGFSREFCEISKNTL